VADASHGWDDGLLAAGFGSQSVAERLSWPVRVERMLEVEAALARAQARLGIITEAQAEGIARACAPGRIDVARLAEEAATAASPVIPLLAQLRETAPEDAVTALHHGATSQDIIATASILQVRDALTAIDLELGSLAERCSALADEHRATLLPGRTLKQQAVPITFGLVAARWLGALVRRREQVAWSRPRVLTVQLGGAAGTLGVYRDQGRALVSELARELDLAAPDLPWHAERDRVVELAGVLSGIVTVVAKIARDVVDLSATEVGEVRVTGPSGGSSAMPHKRGNPTDAMAARAAARLAAGELSVLFGAGGEHEHERAAGAWQAEWVALPSALVRTAGSVERLGTAVRGLQVVADRGAANLASTFGVTTSEALAAALGASLGRGAAQALVGDLVVVALTERRPLVEVAQADERVAEVLTHDEVAAAGDPRASLSNVSAMIDAARTHHLDVAGTVDEVTR
jgi:3-carboxy-cis,cis-muconate cycloisomerase